MLEINFSAIANEANVREFVLTPLLYALGFSQEGEKSIKHEVPLKSDTILGSNTKIKASTLHCDYMLYLDSKAHCALDAKAPDKNIASQSDSERQVFYYAINKDIKAPFYALCNGLEFTLFQTATQELLLSIDLQNELDSKFALLKQYLTTPLESLKQTIGKNSKKPKKSDEWYLSRELPQAILNPKKQNKQRYFGCTAYFTRQSWDIVAQHICNFSDEGDVVLDPFGGSGVTAIEAMINGRIGIHTDLNPLSIFMTKALTSKLNLSQFHEASEEILAEFETLRPKDEKEAKKILRTAKYYPNAISEEFGEIASQKEQDSTLWIPKDEMLPKGSDVDSVLGLFSPTQLAELALLRKLIFKKTTPSGTKEHRIYKRNLRYSLLLAFRNTITMCNLTYHESDARKGKGGNSGVLAYYRYRVAKKPTFLDTAEIYKDKINRVLKGKKELETEKGGTFYESYFTPINRVIKDFSGAMLENRGDLERIDSILEKTNGEKFFQADATKLKEIETQSIDFIYTDPPYEGKIPYLDLSTLWNAWLDLPVDESLKERECIEKGSLEKSKDEYISLMSESLKQMYRVLKPNRWLAFVFQSKNSTLWETLVQEAERIGFEYVGSVRQSNGQSSFKKRQMPLKVLRGQLIVYFKKVQSPRARMKVDFGDDVYDLVLNNIEAIIVQYDGATIEEIYDEIQIRGMELGFLTDIGNDFASLDPIIETNFDYDEESKKYHIKQGQKFKSHKIPLETRTRYFLISYLNKAKRQGKKATFDDICLEIIPLLKNGVSPSKESIYKILQQIAIGDKESGEWRLKEKGEERSLFDE